MDDDKGTSLVILNTQKGKEVFADLNFNCKEEAYSTAVKHNSCIEASVAEPSYRKLFMTILNHFSFKMAHRVVCSNNVIYRGFRRIWLIVNKAS